MKRKIATALLALSLVGDLFVPAIGAVRSDNMAAYLSNTEAATSVVTEQQMNEAAPAEASGIDSVLLDLSLAGVIVLGILGLFWIRRHTSEL